MIVEMKPVSVLYRLSLMYETYLSPRPLVSSDVCACSYVHVFGRSIGGRNLFAALWFVLLFFCHLFLLVHRVEWAWLGSFACASAFRRVTDTRCHSPHILYVVSWPLLHPIHSLSNVVDLLAHTPPCSNARASVTVATVMPSLVVHYVSCSVRRVLCLLLILSLDRYRLDSRC